MANVSIVARLGLDAKSFKAELNGARRRVRRFADSVKSSGLGLIGLGGGLTFAAKSAIDFGSRLTDISAALGIGVEEFQALDEAATRAGVSQEILERGLRNVNGRVQEAIDGNKRYSDALSRLGVDAEALAELPLERRLEAIAVAAKNATDPLEAMRDVQSILGERAGPKLMEVLDRLGTEGFDKIAQDARNAGQIMDTETAVALDNLADKIEAVKKGATIKIATVVDDATAENGLEIITLQLLKAASFFSLKLADGLSFAAQLAFRVLKAPFVAVGERFSGILSVAVQTVKVEVKEILRDLAQAANNFGANIDLSREFFDGLSRDRATLVSLINDAAAEGGRTFSEIVKDEVSKIKPNDSTSAKIADFDAAIATLREERDANRTEDTEKRIARRNPITGEIERDADTPGAATGGTRTTAGLSPEAEALTLDIVRARADGRQREADIMQRQLDVMAKAADIEKKTGVTREEALALARDIAAEEDRAGREKIARLKEIEIGEIKIIELRAAGRDEEADALERKLTILQTALNLQNALNLSTEEAVSLAKRKVAAEEAADKGEEGPERKSNPVIRRDARGRITNLEDLTPEQRERVQGTERGFAQGQQRRAGGDMSTQEERFLDREGAQEKRFRDRDGSQRERFDRKAEAFRRRIPEELVPEPEQEVFALPHQPRAEPGRASSLRPSDSAAREERQAAQRAETAERKGKDKVADDIKEIRQIMEALQSAVGDAAEAAGN